MIIMMSRYSFLQYFFIYIIQVYVSKLKTQGKLHCQTNTGRVLLQGSTQNGKAHTFDQINQPRSQKGHCAVVSY
jgi:hypothetical protein